MNKWIQCGTLQRGGLHSTGLESQRGAVSLSLTARDLLWKTLHFHQKAQMILFYLRVTWGWSVQIRHNVFPTSHSLLNLEFVLLTAFVYFFLLALHCWIKNHFLSGNAAPCQGILGARSLPLMLCGCRFNSQGSCLHGPPVLSTETEGHECCSYNATRSSVFFYVSHLPNECNIMWITS